MPRLNYGGSPKERPHPNPLPPGEGISHATSKKFKTVIPAKAGTQNPRENALRLHHRQQAERHPLRRGGMTDGSRNDCYAMEYGGSGFLLSQE